LIDSTKSPIWFFVDCASSSALRLSASRREFSVSRSRICERRFALSVLNWSTCRASRFCISENWLVAASRAAAASAARASALR